MKGTILVVAVAALALGGCGGGGEAEDSAPQVEAELTVDLRFPLIEDALTDEGSAAEECRGALDYSDVKTGAAVTFRDAKGTIVQTTDLAEPEVADNLVTCTWKVAASFDSATEFVVAEVGGWKSEPQRVSGGRVAFALDTVAEQAGGGSKAEVDPSWTRS